MSRSNKTVLILDDDDSVRESLIDFFEDQGWIVTSAATAEIALNLINISPPAGVLVDIRLPGMDGNTFMKTISQTHPKLACVIITGSPDYYFPEEIQNLPQISDQIFSKPILNLFELKEVLEQQILAMNNRK